MQIEKLLEEQKEFEEKMQYIVEFLDKNNDFLLSDSDAKYIIEFPRKSLKQFIDGLVAYSQDKLEKCKKLRLSKYITETPEYFDGKIAILEDQISYLKKIGKQLE